MNERIDLTNDAEFQRTLKRAFDASLTLRLWQSALDRLDRLALELRPDKAPQTDAEFLRRCNIRWD